MVILVHVMCLRTLELFTLCKGFMDNFNETASSINGMHVLLFPLACGRELERPVQLGLIVRRS